MKIKECKCKDCKGYYIPTFINGLKTSTRCPKCLKKWNRLKKKKQLERQKIAKKKKREKKRDTNKYWGKKCWKLFAKQLKEKNASFQGYASCYTCNAISPVKELQAGHCFHRGNRNWRKIDFDSRHIHLQDAKCNMFGGGAIPIFTANLIRDEGWEYYEELKKGADAEAMTVEELKELFKKLNKDL